MSVMEIAHRGDEADGEVLFMPAVAQLADFSRSLADVHDYVVVFVDWWLRSGALAGAIHVMRFPQAARRFGRLPAVTIVTPCRAVPLRGDYYALPGGVASRR